MFENLDSSDDSSSRPDETESTMEGTWSTKEGGGTCKVCNLEIPEVIKHLHRYSIFKINLYVNEYPVD